MDLSKMSPIERAKFMGKVADRVLWAKAFVSVFSPVSKKVAPWTARWYQVEMLRDTTLKKVARCGRRTGRLLPFAWKLREGSYTLATNLVWQHSKGATNHSEMVTRLKFE